MPRTKTTSDDAILALKDDTGDVIEIEPGYSGGTVFIEIIPNGATDETDQTLVLLRRKDVKRLRKALKKAARA